MEADGALKLIIDLNDKTDAKVNIEYIAADDDSTMRALLRHQSTTSTKGKLPTNIPEPSFLADPSHRTKVGAKPIYILS